MKKFTKSHEWYQLEGNTATIGITNLGVKEIGEITYIEFPQVGKSVVEGQVALIIESTKAAIDILSPVSGVIVEINQALHNNLDLLNHSPEGEGWLFKVQL